MTESVQWIDWLVNDWIDMPWIGDGNCAIDWLAGDTQIDDSKCPIHWLTGDWLIGDAWIDNKKCAICWID